LSFLEKNAIDDSLSLLTCFSEAPMAVSDASVERSNVTPSIGCASKIAFASSALQISKAAMVSAFQGSFVVSFTIF